MPMETKKLLNNGKPITPKGLIRSKSGPYLAPRLSTSVRLTPSPEVRRDGRVGGTEFNVNRGNITTPVKSFLATNITPRSSSRKSRTDSTNSTPNGTPSSPGPDSTTVSVGELQEGGARSEMGIRNARAGSVISNNTRPPISRGSQSVDVKAFAAIGAESPMFFHASDVNSISKNTTHSGSKAGACFMYADGRREEPAIRPASQVGSKTVSQVGVQHKSPQPNGTIERSHVMSASPKGISPASSPKLTHSIVSPVHNVPRHRSTSPLKEFETPGRQSLNRGRRTSGVSNASSATAIKSTTSALHWRPISYTSSVENRTHVKTQSMNSMEVYADPQRITRQIDSSLFAIQSPKSIRHRSTSPGSFNIQTTFLNSPISPMSPLISPDRMTSSASQDKIEQLNSMAASARRERKVLDLEISNSSLLAINRTLEREMRKQKIELRRYRRLTSGGRISFVPKERAISGTTTISTLSFGSDLTYGSDEENELTDIPSESDDEDEDCDDSDNSTLSLAPEAQAARDLRQRHRDEKRLQLDLSKHQQLLIDSQKMNESLKRCMSRTEELILEGRKALEYRVRVGEIRIGGRVLHEDDNPEMQDAQPRHGLLSPADIVNPEDLLWAAGTSPAGMSIHQPEDHHTSLIADEGKEFREYLDTLVEPSR